MNNLIILGNGFDLSHGLKTRYIDFINFIFESHLQDRNKHKNLINFPDYIDNLDTFFELAKGKAFPDHIIKIIKEREAWTSRREIELRNSLVCSFVRDMVNDRIQSNNWSDIEELYFKILVSASSNEDVVQLNIDFSNLKNALQEYLHNQQTFSKPMESYHIIFQQLCNEQSVILNFNYTDTVNRLYHNEVSKAKLLHIHGELFNDSNPIIFGYAADENEIGDLIDRNNNDYLRNIKRHAYKRTNNEAILKEYLDINKNINVFILGHSCGLSDKLILNEIMNHGNIDSIRVFYYENHDSYFNSHINLFRIMKNKNNYDKKIINFQDSIRIPQIEDDNDKIKITEEYINSVLEKEKIKENLRLNSALKNIVKKTRRVN